MDFAFIDGDHSLTATISDFMLLEDYLAMNGVYLLRRGELNRFTRPPGGSSIYLAVVDIGSGLK